MKKILIALILLATSSFSQEVEYTSTNKKALKAMEKAMKFYQDKKDTEALEQLQITIMTY